MKDYKAIIYDIDGTILNTLDMNMYPLLKIIEEELGETWELKDVLKFASYPGMKVMEELKIKSPTEVYQRWVKYVNEYEDGATLYNGFSTVFEKFSTTPIKQAIVSAKTQKQYEIDFVSKNLDKYMAATILAEDTSLHKPDPTPLLSCLAKLELEPAEAIYIGDALSDYQASANAKMDFGYARWGSVTDEGIISPTFTFEQPMDLLQLLTK